MDFYQIPKSILRITLDTTDWRELPDKKASRILIEKPVNLDDHDEWHSQFDWIIDTCIKFKKAFKKFI